tara:strand:- start:1025 stop:1240 length:216 start_codon:yes stop_codon:yes gene_type:complete
LKNAGCITILQEASGRGNKERLQLDRSIEILWKGDEIVFTKLDNGFKNQRQCINTLHNLQKQGIQIVQLME